LPQVVSAPPIALSAPWVTYSAPSGPKASEFVSWSLTERGRFTTTGVYVPRSAPVSRPIRPDQSGTSSGPTYS
jgi:hypothetical protein